MSRSQHRRFSLRPLRAALAALVIAGYLASSGHEATADVKRERLERLSRALSDARDEKTRIAAAVNLGRIRDSNVLRPLLRALGDDSSAVRAVAAAALGNLGYAAALPALHRAASDDDELVRKRAREAIRTIEVKAGAKRRAARLLPNRSSRRGSYQVGARERPLMQDSVPRLHIVVESVADKSSAGPERLQRRRARALRGLVDRELGADPSVTIDREAAEELDLSPYSLDISIVDLDRNRTKKHVEVSCELRVAISDDGGRIMSFLTGGARVQVPRRTFRRDYLQHHQREAMKGAIEGLRPDIVSFLTREIASR